MINYYEILEISPNASKEIIEKSYKVLAKKYHPDLNPENKKEAEAKMKLVNEAYNILIDDEKRANYDSVFKRKQEQESKRQSNNSVFSSDTSKHDNEKNTSNYDTETYVDEDENFVINTTQMDKKTQERIKKKLEERYLDAYDQYLRSRGYKLKYKWTFKRIMSLVLVILISIIVLVILYFIPPINQYCHELYNSNIFIKLVVDLIKSFFTSIWNLIT